MSFIGDERAAPTRAGGAFSIRRLTSDHCQIGGDAQVDGMEDANDVRRVAAEYVGRWEVERAVDYFLEPDPKVRCRIDETMIHRADWGAAG
jgi:hypothetical protein